MKKIIFVLVLFMCGTVLAAPDNSMSISAPSSGTTISSSDETTRYNEITSKFNAHNHTGTTEVGTIVTGTWNATVITATFGGTGLSTITDGAVMLGSGTGAVTPLAVTTNGAILIGDGTTDPTTYSAFSSSTGTLKVSAGGTSLSTITDGAVMLGSGTGAVTPLAVTTDGAIIIGDGTTDPTTLNAFDSSTGTLKVASGGTGSSSTTYCSLTANVSGTLPVANGGTNQTTTGLAFGGKVIAYTGNGNDNRNIAHGLGRTPIIVIIGTVTTGSIPELWLSGFAPGFSVGFSGLQHADNYIQAVDGTNVQVGTGGEVNLQGNALKMFVL